MAVSSPTTAWLLFGQIVFPIYRLRAVIPIKVTPNWMAPRLTASQWLEMTGSKMPIACNPWQRLKLWAASNTWTSGGRKVRQQARPGQRLSKPLLPMNFHLPYQRLQSCGNAFFSAAIPEKGNWESTFKAMLLKVAPKILLIFPKYLCVVERWAWRSMIFDTISIGVPARDAYVAQKRLRSCGRR